MIIVVYVLYYFKDLYQLFMCSLLILSDSIISPELQFALYGTKNASQIVLESLIKGGCKASNKKALNPIHQKKRLSCKEKPMIIHQRIKLSIDIKIARE